MDLDQIVRKNRRIVRMRRGLLGGASVVVATALVIGGAAGLPGLGGGIDGATTVVPASSTTSTHVPATAVPGPPVQVGEVPHVPATAVPGPPVQVGEVPPAQPSVRP